MTAIVDPQRPRSSQGTHPLARLSLGMVPYFPMVITAAALLVLLLWGEKFWLTNDDIGMAMTVGGYGTAATPSPGLVIDCTVVWGWILEHVPDVAHVRGYTLATYLLLFVSGLSIFSAARRRGVAPVLIAPVLLGMYATVVLYPQYTLLSGYLAVAGFAQVLASEGRSRRRALLIAAPLLLLSGLIRPDEMALVFIVACPFLLYAWRNHSEARWRWQWTGLACLCAVLLAGAYLYTQHYGSTGAWTAFGDIDGPRTDFTDYDLRGYYRRHTQQLAGGPITLNDVELMASFFYVDPTVFNSGNVEPLVRSVTPAERYELNEERGRKFFSVFKDPDLQLMLALFTVLALLNWRQPAAEIASLVLLLALMVGIGLWGRPGILRIYLPATAAMMVLSLLKLGPRRVSYLAALGGIALATGLWLCWQTDATAKLHAEHAARLRATVCGELPKGQLIVVWTGGADFEWKELYRPTTPDDTSCNPSLYSIDTYQLAAPNLALLHAYTGGKDFIEALLAGQSFYITAGREHLVMLDRFLREHHHSSLKWTEMPGTADLKLYTIHAVAAPPP